MADSKKSVKALTAKLKAEKSENEALRLRLEEARKQSLEMEMTCKKKCNEIESKANWQTCERKEEVMSKVLEIDTLTKENDNLHKENMELQLGLQVQAKKQQKLVKVIERKTHFVNKKLKAVHSQIDTLKWDNEDLRKQNLELQVRLCKEAQTIHEIQELNRDNVPKDHEGERMRHEQRSEQSYDRDRLKSPEVTMESLMKENAMLRTKNEKTQKQLLDLQLKYRSCPESKGRDMQGNLFNKVKGMKTKFLEKYGEVTDKASKKT